MKDINKTKEQVIIENNQLKAKLAELEKYEPKLLANKVLVKSEYYYTKAQEIGKIGSWELDIIKNELTWTDQNYLNFGIPLGAALTYELFLKCIHPEDREYVNTEWKEALKGKPYDIEHRLIIDGDVRWLREKAEINYDADGNPISAIGFTQDITEHKLAKEALRQSEVTIKNKLKAITDPEGDIGTLDLSDIIDTDVLQSMMEDFYQLTGMLGAVLDVSGKVLVAVGWQDVCTKFHRCNPDTLKNCTESDTILTNGVPEGTFKAYHCKNNMWDIVTPIMIGGRHVGNVFMGQYFLEDELPDYEFFREQARKYGFDEKEYLAALDQVPRFSKETVDAGMKFYSKLAGLISTMSFSSIQQSRMLAEQKHAEEKIKESEEKYKALYENAPLSYQSLNENGTFKDINPHWLEILGYDRDEVIGKKYVDFLHPDWKEHFEKSFPAFKKRGYVNNVQFKIRHKDGHYIDISFKGCIGYNTDGSFKQTYCVFQDITANKKAEKDLIRSEEKYRLLFERDIDAIFMYNPETTEIIEANKATSELYGYSPEELPGKSVFEFSAEIDQSIAQQKKMKKDGQIQVPLRRHKKKDGSIIYVDVKGFKINLQNKEVMFAITKNITDQVLAEEALKKQNQEYEALNKELSQTNKDLFIAKNNSEESERKLKVALRSMTDAIFISDNEGNFIDFNEAFATFHKFKNKEECSKNLKDFPVFLDVFSSDGELVPLEMWVVPKALRGETGTNKEYTLKRKDTGETWVGSYNYSPIRNNEGDIIGSVVTARDITDLKKVQQDIEIAKKKAEESEKKYRDLVNLAQEGIWVIDNNNITTFANPSMAKMLLYSPEEMIGKPLFDFMDEAGQKIANENLERRKAGLAEQHDFEFICKNGDRIFCTMATSPIVDKTGNYQGAIAGVIDITERKLNEEKIKNSEEKFKSLMHQSPFVVELYDIDGLQVEVNKAYEELWGFPASTTLNSFNILKSKEVHETGLIEYVNKAYSGETVKVPEYEFNPIGYTESKGHGRIKYLNTSIYPIKSLNNEVSNIVVVHQDITERKKIENELHESQEIFKNFMEHSPVYVFFKDENMRAIQLSKNYELLLNKPLKDLLGKNMDELFPSDLAKNMIADDIRILKENKVVSIEEELNGRSYSTIKFPIQIEGKPPYLAGYSIDVTEKKQFLKKLQERNEYIESVMDKMPIGFALNSIEDGKVKYMNNSFEEIYGWSRDTLTNTSLFFEKVFPDSEYREKMTTEIIADMQSGDPKRMIWKDLKIVTSTGEVRYVHAHNIPLIDQNLMISTVQDTTKRKLAEDELIKHHENLEELVKERTKDLEDKNKELERFNNLFVDREIRIKELKEKIKELEA